MRKIIAGTFMSIDGVMQAPGGPEGRTRPAASPVAAGPSISWDDAHGWRRSASRWQIRSTCCSRPQDLQDLAAHWPYAGDDNPVAVKFDAVTKYVATSSTAPLTWTIRRHFNGDVAAGSAGSRDRGANL